MTRCKSTAKSAIVSAFVRISSRRMQTSFHGFRTCCAIGLLSHFPITHLRPRCFIHRREERPFLHHAAFHYLPARKFQLRRQRFHQPPLRLIAILQRQLADRLQQRRKRPLARQSPTLVKRLHFACPVLLEQRHQSVQLVHQRRRQTAPAL